MIKNNFYPTDFTDAIGNEFTKSIKDIPITSSKFTDAYWLGWISYENIPPRFRMSQLTQRGSSYVFKDVTPVQNVDYGLCANPSDSAYGHDVSLAVYGYSSTDGKWTARFKQSTTADTNRRLINSESNYNLMSTLRLRIYISYGNWGGASGTASYMYDFESDEEFKDFLNGTATTVFYEYDHDGIKHTINLSDFTADNRVQSFQLTRPGATEPTTHYCWLGFDIDSERDVYYDGDTDTYKLGSYSTTMPMVSMYDLNNEQLIMTGRNQRDETNGFISINNITTTPTVTASAPIFRIDVDNAVYLGGIECSLDLNALNGMREWSVEQFGNAAVQRYYNNSRVYRAYSVDEIIKECLLYTHLFRYGATPIESWGPADSQVFQTATTGEITTPWLSGLSAVPMLEDW